MTVKVKGVAHDTVAEACKRLDISRNTLLSYIRQGVVSEPPYVRKGKTDYRYFPDAWYAENLSKVQRADASTGVPMSEDAEAPDT